MTRAEIDDALRLREILEVGAARMAASRTLTAAEREVLWSRLTDVRGAPADDYRRLDSRLHLAIAEAAGSPSLVPLVAENRMRLNGLLDQIPLLSRNIAHSDEQHEAIVMAILAGDGDGAAAAMRAHVGGFGGAAARLPGLDAARQVRSAIHAVLDGPATKCHQWTSRQSAQVERASSALADVDTTGWTQRFDLLSDPNRLEILLGLHRAPGICVGDLAAALGRSENAVSQALRVLRQQGWVSSTRVGRAVSYRLDDESCAPDAMEGPGLEALTPFAPLDTRWATILAAIERLFGRTGSQRRRASCWATCRAARGAHRGLAAHSLDERLAAS